MTKILIFDRNSGFLQWESDETDDMAALVEFDAKVGIACNNSLDDLPAWKRDAMTEDEIAEYRRPFRLSDWKFHRVDDETAAKVAAWSARRSPASEFPLDA